MISDTEVVNLRLWHGLSEKAKNYCLTYSGALWRKELLSEWIIQSDNFCFEPRWWSAKQKMHTPLIISNSMTCSHYQGWHSGSWHLTTSWLCTQSLVSRGGCTMTSFTSLTQSQQFPLLSPLSLSTFLCSQSSTNSFKRRSPIQAWTTGSSPTSYAILLSSVCSSQSAW